MKKHILSQTGTEPSSKHYFEDFVEFCHPLRGLQLKGMDRPGADMVAKGSEPVCIAWHFPALITIYHHIHAQNLQQKPASFHCLCCFYSKHQQRDQLFGSTSGRVFAVSNKKDLCLPVSYSGQDPCWAGSTKPSPVLAQQPPAASLPEHGCAHVSICVCTGVLRGNPVQGTGRKVWQVLNPVSQSCGASLIPSATLYYKFPHLYKTVCHSQGHFKESEILHL